MRRMLDRGKTRLRRHLRALPFEQGCRSRPRASIRRLRRAGIPDCWNRYWAWTKTDDFKQQMREIVSAPDFLDDNYLSTEVRVPVTLLQTNACSPLATNALAGNIWDNFSSQSYKDLPSVGDDHGVRPVHRRPAAVSRCRPAAAATRGRRR